MTSAELPDTTAKALRDALRRRVPAKKFETWFSSFRLVAIDGQQITFAVDNSFQLDWIRNNFGDIVDEVVSEVLAPGMTIRYVIESEPMRAVRPAPPVAPGPSGAEVVSERAAAGISLNPAYTFDSFIVGPSNQFAHAAARAVADAPAGSYNPLFLHGAVGLGKTHLLQAICHRALARGGDMKVLYLSSEAFVNEFISAIEKGDLGRFRYRYRTVDLLLIDDIHLLAHKERTQEEFFHTFNTLYNEGRQIVLSSDAAPADIPSLRDRLVSRFEWGLVSEITPPRFETRLAILARKAKDRGASIPNDVLEFLASRIERNIRELEGAITKVLGYAELFGRPIDLDLARQALQQTGDGSSRPVTQIEKIVESVCRHFGVTPADVHGRRRTQSIVLPRQIVMFLARQLTNMSYEEIGMRCGGRDHSTALYAVRKVESRLDTDLSLANAVRDLQRELGR